jgi:hypothetical protein
VQDRYRIVELEGDTTRILSFGYLVYDLKQGSDVVIAWFRDWADLRRWCVEEKQKGHPDHEVANTAAARSEA